MINTKCGVTRISGSYSELFADFTVITKALRETFIGKGLSTEDVEKEINRCIEESKKSETELNKEIVNKLIKKIIADL